MARSPSQQRYAEKNREKLRKKALESYHAKKDLPGERERRADRNKSWNDRNPGYHLKQYQKNREKVLFRNRRRELRIKAIDELSPGEWEKVVSDCNDTCIVPGCETSPVTMDHVVPLSKNGRHHIDNLQPLCSSCNDRKGVKEVDYRAWA